MTHSQLERRVRHLTHYAVGLTLLLLALVLGAFGYSTTRFEVLEVERINVVEPDGRVSLVISNAARIPGPVFGGEELPREMARGRAGSSGIVFYNAEGTESGGLVTQTAVTDSGYVAYGKLAFDQFNQDQAVEMTYSDAEGEGYAGILVYDNPSVPLIELVRASEAFESGSASERATARALFEGLEVAPQTQRLFVGKEGDTSLLVMNDRQGRTRIRMVVTDDGTPVLDFLDEDGSLLQRLPHHESTR